MEKKLNHIQMENSLKPAAKSHLYCVARLPTRRPEAARLSQLEVLASTRSCFALSPAESFEGGSLGKESAATSNAAQVSWPRSKQLYELERIVGMGTTATVYTALCRQRMENCALKVVDVKTLTTDLDEILKDIQAMTALVHKNIMNYHTVFVDRNELLLVLPLSEQGSLYDVILRKKMSFDCSRGVLDELTIATILSGVLSGLDYLHSNSYVHKNIRAENILLGDDGSVKIGEFAVHYSTGKNLPIVGSSCWLAPEKIEQPNKKYKTSFDIWSLGITTIESIIGLPPYSKEPSIKVLMLIRLNAPPTLESIADVRDQYVTYGKSIRQFIADCLQKDPQKRPSAMELKSHPFFKKAKDEEFLRSVLAAIPQFENNRFDTPSEKRIRWKQMKRKKWLLPEDFDCIQPEQQVEEACEDKEELSGAQKIASTKSYSISKDFLWAKPSISSGVYTVALKIRGLHFEFPMILKRDMCNKRDLYEIKFEFVTHHDTPEAVATNLLREGLIDRRDQNLIADNLSKLLKDPAAENVTFKLKSDIPKSETACEWNFIGYASLRIVKFAEEIPEQLG